MTNITPFLEKAEKYHGHICSGQVLGIRMSLMALRLLDLKPEDNLRDLVIFLETDRCVADATHVVTGVTLGRRRVKVYGYGKTAMSFLDLKSGRAVRVHVTTSDRPPHDVPKQEQIAFWEKYADDDIFAWQEVHIDMPEGELPGPPVRVRTVQDPAAARAGHSKARLHQHACQHPAGAARCGAGAVVDFEPLRRDRRERDVSDGWDG